MSDESLAPSHLVATIADHSKLARPGPGRGGRRPGGLETTGILYLPQVPSSGDWPGPLRTGTGTMASASVMGYGSFKLPVVRVSSDSESESESIMIGVTVRQLRVTGDYP